LRISAKETLSARSFSYGSEKSVEGAQKGISRLRPFPPEAPPLTSW
jgi:hypothetical protein